MSWFWIAIALTVPTAMAFLVALPFWRKGSHMMGNVIGSGVIFIAVILLFGREYVTLAQLRESCTRAGVACSIRPDDFIRYAIYGSIGFVEVFALFGVSLTLEERLRRRERSPGWQ